MKVTLVDYNAKGLEPVVQALSLCRDKPCTYETVIRCLEAKPVPHLSPLEMTWFCFLVEGLSVKARIQLERHRLFSSLERSTRAIDMSAAELVIPEGVRDKEMFRRAYQQAMENYTRALEVGESLEDASYLLPLGVTTRFQLAGNGRVWLEWLNKRLCKKYVQPEHHQLARMVHQELSGISPELKQVFQFAVPCRYCNECAQLKEVVGHGY